VRSRWLDIGQVLFFACLWTETKLRSINSQKRMRPISSHLDRTNLVNKGFIIWLSRKFFMRDTASSPKRARWLHLAHSGSQSQRAIWFILPARGASHIISLDISPWTLSVPRSSQFSSSYALGKLFATRNRWCPWTNILACFCGKWRLLFIYTMPYKYGKCTQEFLGAFLFPFQSSFPRFWGFLKKQLFHLRWFDTRWL